MGIVETHAPVSAPVVPVVSSPAEFLRWLTTKPLVNEMVVLPNGVELLGLTDSVPPYLRAAMERSSSVMEVIDRLRDVEHNEARGSGPGFGQFMARLVYTE